jgi:hypothetical protein
MVNAKFNLFLISKVREQGREQGREQLKLGVLSTIRGTLDFSIESKTF